LSLPLQAKILRVLQERQVTRIGETSPRRADFRLICATHRDLESAVAKGGFREDLYFRIAGALLTLPPLRERGDDVILLADHFQKRFCISNGLAPKPLTETAMHCLKHHRWRGN